MIVLSRFLGKFENLIQTVGLSTSFTFFLEILKKKSSENDQKKKKKKKSSENDQLTGHFQSFFIYFFRPLDPKSEKQFP